MRWRDLIARKVQGWLEHGLLTPLRDRSEVVAAPEIFLLAKPRNLFGKRGLLLPAHRPSRKEGPQCSGQGCSSLGASRCRAFHCSLDPRRLHLVCPALWWWNGHSLPVAQNPSFLGHQHICHWLTLTVGGHMAGRATKVLGGRFWGTDLGQAPLSMVWFISRVSPSPSTCHLLAGNTLSFLQGAQCIWHK